MREPVTSEPAPTDLSFHDAEIADALAMRGAAQLQNSVQIGDVVPYFQNGVGVIQWTVVDVESALDRVEVLLDRNGLSVLPEDSANVPSDAASEVKAGAAARRKLDGDQQWVLVYVDASRETIAQVLNELSQEPIFTQAKLQPPVDAPDEGEVGLSEAPSETAEGISDTKSLAADQVLVNDALVVSQNYSRARQQSTALPNADEQLRQNATAKDALNVGRAAMPKSARAMSHTLHDFAVPAGESPADAMLAQNIIAPAFRKQRGATILQMNPLVDELENNTIVLEQRAFIDRKLSEKAKTSPVPDRAEEEKLLENLVEPSVRLLLVLQPPAADRRP
jgi:hypothetical protein